MKPIIMWQHKSCNQSLYDKTHFFLTALASTCSNNYIHKFQREKDLFITLSIVYIQISNTHLPEFLNILLYVEANPVQKCR